MKEFIVLLACLPVLLVCLMQFTLDQVNYAKTGAVEEIVIACREKAKQAGCFTEDICDEMRSSLASAAGVEAENILIEATNTPVYRIDGGDSRGLIYYKVMVPTGKLMAGEGFFGISAAENSGYYIIEAYTPSELIQ